MVLDDLSVWGVAWLLIQGVLVFVISTFVFDSLHWALHRWAKSRIGILRTFSRWHFIHHKFLDKRLRINAEWRWMNFWYHLVPEFLTAVVGTSICYLFFHWLPVTAVLALHLWNFANEVRMRGMGENHMEMKRTSGKRGTFYVNPVYHAQHHILFDAAFSSYFNVFDMVFGTATRLTKRRVLVTGANGAFGSAMVRRLRKLGAIVDTAAYGIDYTTGHYDRLVPKLARADIVVLAHGARHGDEACMSANCTTFVDIIGLFREAGKDRLNVPEVWALGSEAEFHGDMGQADLVDYVASKRAFAREAREFYADDDLYYRHIVPSSFTSAMGKGAMSADTAVNIALFFIRRGFRYVPVTLTTLAFWNYFRFIGQRPVRRAPSEVASG